MKMLSRLMLLAIAILPEVVQADSLSVPAYKTGNDIYASCSDTSSRFEDGYCFGYIVGATDVLIGSRSGQLVCLPEGVNAQQLVDVVMKYLRDTPELRERSAGSITRDALVKAFQCK